MGETLPVLIDRARSSLVEARTLPDLLEARALAMAARHYARVTKAPKETQAGCLLLIKRAEIQLADEIEAMLQRGELAPLSGCRKPTQSGKATHEVRPTARSKTPVACPSADKEMVDE